VCSPKAARTPKTILGHPFNEKIDVWMAGCLTLQMLTGKIPILPHGPNQPWEGIVLAGYVEELAQHPERYKVHWGHDGDEYPVTKAKPFVLTKDTFAPGYLALVLPALR
jgi:hypothetical protein